jgi:thiamine biosynthesis lipoprotein
MKPLTLTLIISLLLFTPNLKSQNPYSKSLILMGSGFTITINETDSIKASEHIESAINEIKRIENVISSWDASSETSKINDNSGLKPVTVSPELFNLIERCITISKLTDGAFDISYASMDKVWKFDGSMLEIPSEETVNNSVTKVGYKNIILNKEKLSVFLQNKGMKIGFGAIGKGYAADRAKNILINRGVKSGIVNASGDINAWGNQSTGENWTIGIVNPLNKNRVFATLPINNEAVVTSGNYEKYVSFNGKRYSHIIDPRTGYPASGIISVTVFAPKAELADALATSVFVMGLDSGIDRINQIPNTECIVITTKGEIITSDNVKLSGK